VGSSHWPDMASRYFVIHAPSMATVVWKMIAPIAGEHMHHKVSCCASGGIASDCVRLRLIASDLRLIATLIGKVVISRGVPAELIEVLGGDAAAVGRLEHCSPHVAPDAPFVEPRPPRVVRQ